MKKEEEEQDNIMHIEIQGFYDGVAFTYNRDTDECIWRQVAIERSTEEWRKEFEQSIIKQFKQQDV